MPREPLPNRRHQETLEIDHDGHRYSVSFGYHHDGRPGEVFIQAHKHSSPLEAAARDAAILISLATQYGTPLAQLREGVTRGEDGAAASVVGAVLDAMEGAL